VPFPYAVPDPGIAALQHGEAGVAAECRWPLGRVSFSRIIGVSTPI
jgi:hypothetical protein